MFQLNTASTSPNSIDVRWTLPATEGQIQNVFITATYNDQCSNSVPTFRTVLNSSSSISGLFAITGLEEFSIYAVNVRIILTDSRTEMVMNDVRTQGSGKWQSWAQGSGRKRMFLVFHRRTFEKRVCMTNRYLPLQHCYFYLKGKWRWWWCWWGGGGKLDFPIKMLFAKTMLWIGWWKRQRRKWWQERDWNITTLEIKALFLLVFCSPRLS